VVDLNLGDVTNLYAGATWHVTDTVNLWLKGGNLLNKRWDDLYGMGAQRLNVMAGVGLAF
ncbi:MAG: TonB-dependent receptor, partial [Bacteroidales bacterium]|nr:TonB-dependent receptor [Candidatus Sodaliphilus aphodohippi]